MLSLVTWIFTNRSCKHKKMRCWWTIRDWRSQIGCV